MKRKLKVKRSHKEKRANNYRAVNTNVRKEITEVHENRVMQRVMTSNGGLIYKH